MLPEQSTVTKETHLPSQACSRAAKPREASSLRKRLRSDVVAKYVRRGPKTKRRGAYPYLGLFLANIEKWCRTRSSGRQRTFLVASYTSSSVGWLISQSRQPGSEDTIGHRKSKRRSEAESGGAAAAQLHAYWVRATRCLSAPPIRSDSDRVIVLRRSI